MVQLIAAEGEQNDKKMRAEKIEGHFRRCQIAPRYLSVKACHCICSDQDVAGIAVPLSPNGFHICQAGMNGKDFGALEMAT